MRRNATKLAAVTLILIAGFPLMALALNTSNPPPPPPQLFSDTGDVFNFIENIISFLFWIIMMFAVIFILWAAFNYLTAQGNPEKVQSAQKMLLYAVIAIVIALIARSVPAIIGSFVQSAAQNNSGYGP